MAGNQKEKSILFPANISSPFDNLSISSGTILAPPAQQLQPVDTEEKQNDNVPDGISQSIQPHLENMHLMTSVSTPSSNFGFPTSATPNPNQKKDATPPPPPLTISNQGNSFLRRPASKYVVPPKISSNNLPLFTPVPLPQPVPTISPVIPNLIPFTPSSDYGSITTSNNNNHTDGFATSETSPMSGFAIDLPTNVGYKPQTFTSSIIPASFDNMAANPPVQGTFYHPVIPHWFFRESKGVIWKPFSFVDSINLEEAFRKGSTEKVATDGGRYDVIIKDRKRVPVFWEGEGNEVMRCSWFRRSYSEVYPIPYSEEVAEKLEEEYKDAMLCGQWHRQVELPAGERVMLNSPYSMHHYHIQEPTDPPNLTAISESQYPQTVKRGADDFEIKDGDPERVDHLLFLIHGIGSACDFSFRSVEECVDDFRSMGDELLSTHFKDSIEKGLIGRVEILPISWHKALHGDQTGLDEKLRRITLRSIPKLREFTNDTLLDVFLYTSPKYCQHIMDTVTNEMEKLLSLFRQRHPTFEGGVSLGGHSLGSVILFDLLMHQNPERSDDMRNSSYENMNSVTFASNEQDLNSLDGSRCSLTSQVNFEIGIAGTGQPVIIYPQLSFHPQAFFMMGSPVGMFITIRGIDTLGPTFKLPTCNHVFNIFHPFDPVAYRLETLLDSSFADSRPVLIPHHKGRKRMHLELKDTIERVGSDIKNKIVDSIQSTWNRFYQIYTGSESDAMRTQVDHAVEEEMHRANPDSHAPDDGNDIKIGQLNRGLRVDYVLQEKPYESFTEYIFALQAHVSYWNSEDTLLMILKELYKIDGILSDSRLYHQKSTEAEGTHTPPTAFFQSSTSTPKSDPPSATPPPPVPLFSPTQTTSTLPPAPTDAMVPRTLRGRPTFDPLKGQMPSGGMDPTAPPASSGSLPPPPIMTTVNFNRKKPS